MIIKGRVRGRARQLVQHLLRADQNESIRVYECRGTLAADVEGALMELEARAKTGRSSSPLYHASISPEAAHPLTDAQVRQAVDLLEEKLGLHGQPRVVVLHRKENRDHVHVVWSRIDADTGNAATVSWNYRIHEQVARELERRFGHPSVRCSKARPPVSKLRPAQDYEWRQEERTGIPAAAITSELTALWSSSSSGEEFRCRLEEAGYVLARGDRRVFVVIDQAGNVHSLARRIQGATTADVRAKLEGVRLNGLPSVAEARSSIQKRHTGAALQRDFKQASREVAERPRGRPRSVDISVRRRRGDRPDMVARFVPDAPTVSRQARTTRRGTSPAYRSMRAALVAEFASRIAQAFRHLPPHEIDAAIAALRAERTAALKALLLSQSTGRTDQVGHRTHSERHQWGRLKRFRLRFRRRITPK
jgi:relaxase-like protein